MTRRRSKDLFSLPDDVDTLSDSECPDCGGDVVDFECSDCGREITYEEYDDPDTEPRGEAAERKEEIVEEYGSEEEEVMAKLRQATAQEVDFLFGSNNPSSKIRTNRRSSARTVKEHSPKERKSSVLTTPKNSQFYIEDDEGKDAGFGNFTTKEEAEEFLEESGAPKSDFSIKQDEDKNDSTKSRKSSRQSSPESDAPLVTDNYVTVGDDTSLDQYGGPASKDDFFTDVQDTQAPENVQTHMSPDDANTGDGATQNPHWQDNRQTSREARLMKIFNFVEERERFGLSKHEDRNKEIARFEGMSDEELDAHISATREASSKSNERVPVRQNRPLPHMGQAREEKGDADESGFALL